MFPSFTGGFRRVAPLYDGFNRNNKDTNAVRIYGISKIRDLDGNVFV